MRTVYADVVFLMNFAVDYFILYISFSFLHLKVGFIRIVLSAVTGSLFSVICAVTGPFGLSRIPVSVLIAAIMIYICIGKQRLKTYIKSFACIYAFSVMLSGVVMLLHEERSKVSFMLLSLCCLVLFTSVHAFGRLFRCSSVVKHVDAFVEICGHRQKLSLLCDSGNILTDPYTNLPVIILKETFESEAYTEGVRLVPVVTVSGSSLIKVVTPRNIQLIHNGRGVDVCAAVGFCGNICADFMGFDGIIPQSLCEYI